MRQEQFKGWFMKILKTFFDDVTGSDINKCVAEKFPGDSPGDLGKELCLLLNIIKCDSKC